LIADRRRLAIMPFPASTAQENMHPEWKEHLTASGAYFQAETLQNFGDEAAERSAASRVPVLLDLSATHGLIRAGGADAATFLNGQLTNDIRRIASGGSLLAGYCTPQGRLLAVAHVFRYAHDCYLMVPFELRDDVLTRLRKFVLRAKVTLVPADDSVVVFGLAGPQAGALLARVLGVPAPAENGSAESGESIVLRVAGPRDRFVLLGPVATAKTVWHALQTAGARPVAGHWWTWFDIEAGIPTVYRATQERFVPQAANLELVGGVSFDKGCYPGQEIVARVHYLGRLKERMFHLHLADTERPQPGDGIYAPGLRGQATGTVAQAHAAPDGGWDVLAVVHLSSAESGELHWGNENGPGLVLRDLPYLFPQTQS
jgi:folate-binding protein YgfZ